ncbi:MAG: phosphatase PAP2 family protein, partial [Persicimonas sp.]
FGFGKSILDAVAIRDDPARENLRLFNEITFYGSMGFRIFDSAIVPWFWHDAKEVSWQMSWIDLQSFGLIAAVLWGTQIYVGRVRPTSAYCDDPDRQGHLCDEDNPEFTRSFIAGHTATSVTAAGLTCVHHSQMPLYGGGVMDDVACGVMVTNAAVNAVTRLMVELHYPSDVAMGVVLGLTAGWVLPRALHYGWGDKARRNRADTRQRTPDIRLNLSPAVIEERPGLMLLGRF